MIDNLEPVETMVISIAELRQALKEGYPSYYDHEIEEIINEMIKGITGEEAKSNVTDQ
jgi:Ca2+-binding EF-hand superfamily protein